MRDNFFFRPKVLQIHFDKISRENLTLFSHLIFRYFCWKGVIISCCVSVQLRWPRNFSESELSEWESQRSMKRWWSRWWLCLCSTKCDYAEKSIVRGAYACQTKTLYFIWSSERKMREMSWFIANMLITFPFQLFNLCLYLLPHSIREWTLASYILYCERSFNLSQKTPFCYCCCWCCHILIYFPTNTFSHALALEKKNPYYYSWWSIKCMTTWNANALFSKVKFEMLWKSSFWVH